jgi:hypothetical protein
VGVTTSTNTTPSTRVGVAQYTVGDGSGLGGFTYITRFGTADATTITNARMFIGLANTTSAPSNVTPDTQTNQIGLAQKDGSSNCFIVYGGSAAQTPIDTGFNCADTTQAYDLAIFAPPNSNNTVYVQVIRLSDNTSYSTTLTGTAGTVLPSSTTLLAHRAWRTNNTTAQTAAFDIASIYIESDQ